jgi:hypothetical protein
MEISGLVTRHSLKEELKAHPAYLTQDQHMKAYYSSDNPHDYAMSVVRDIMSAGKSFDF